MPLIRQLNGTVSNTTAGNSTFSTDNNENVVSTSTLKNNSASVYVDNGFATDLELNKKSIRSVANKTLTGKIGDIVTTGVTEDQSEELSNKIAEKFNESGNLIQDKADKDNIKQDIYNKTIC
jgi:hypothetical protein